MTSTLRIVRRAVPAYGPWPDSVPPVLQRVYAARGVLMPDHAELRLARLHAPDALGGLAGAVALLADAITGDQRIVVVGDFDCDGATGTAVAVRGLRLLGARNVGYRVPHRQVHGYGLTPALVADLAAEDRPALLMTVDSGIACRAGVAAARAHGWRVLVTDHHLPGPELPHADAIVNPNLPGDAFPSKVLAGVGVVFYLLLALRRHLREAGAFPAGEPDLSALLDLVAVGTVADLVPLDYNNRVLVAAGLRRLREGRGQPGLAALAAVAGRPLPQLTAADIGFALAPRLNAAGRLEDMAVGIECLLAEDPAQAQELATLLDRINAERRDRQQAMVDEAEAALAALAALASPASGDGDGDGDGNPAALVLYREHWHPGVVGLVASKIKDQAHRPTIAFAPAEPGSSELRGSARSVPGFHVRDALAAVDARHPGLIERFGGHAMAAGLALRADKLPAFRVAFESEVAATLPADARRAELGSDGPLAPDEFDRRLAEALRAAGPWGQGFPEPVFDNEFEVLDWRVLGERHLKLSLRPAAGAPPVSAIHFHAWAGQAPPARIHAAYQLEPDDFRGRRDVQLLLRHWQPA